MTPPNLAHAAHAPKPTFLHKYETIMYLRNENSVQLLVSCNDLLQNTNYLTAIGCSKLLDLS